MPLHLRRLFCFCGLVLVCLLLAGCVERVLRVRTQPEGATVYINGRQVGETPVSWSFTHYGTVRLDFWRDGYVADTQFVKLEAPWYQWTPMDLFSELLDPRQHVDRHEAIFQLTESVPQLRRPAEEELAERSEMLDRAETLRRTTQ